MSKYRKKPIVIDAIEWTLHTSKEEILSLGPTDRDMYQDSDGNLFIKTLEGDMKAGIGDYIIKGIKGEFYPCKGDIFRATYELVEEQDA